MKKNKCSDKENFMHCEFCKIFSSASRIKILNVLRDGKETVNDIVKQTNLSQSNVSQHLAFFRLRGIMSVSRVGKNVFYGIKYPKLFKAYDIIEQVYDKINKGE